MVSFTFRAFCLVKNVEVDYVLLLKPLFGLINDNCFTFGHFYSHTTAGIFVKELAFGLVELFSHGSGDCVLIHEKVVPVSFIVEVCLQNLLFFFLVIRLNGYRHNALFFTFLLFLHLLLLILVFRMIRRIFTCDFRDDWLSFGWLDVKFSSLEVCLI